MKALRVKNPQPTRAQILDAGADILDFEGLASAFGQGDGQGIESKIPPEQVLVQRPRANLGQGAGPGVGLGSRTGEIDGTLGHLDPEGSEAAMLDHLGLSWRSTPGDRPRIRRGNHEQVDVPGIAPEQDIPHRPAHEVEVRLGGAGLGRQALHQGHQERGEARQHTVPRDPGAHRRPGLPVPRGWRSSTVSRRRPRLTWV